MSIPTIACPGGNSCLSRASRALRLRSPRDKPLRSLMDVLLDALGYQARQPHQEDVFTSSTDAHEELLACAGVRVVRLDRWQPKLRFTCAPPCSTSHPRWTAIQSWPTGARCRQ